MTKRRKKHYKSITKRSLLLLSAREVPRRGGTLSQRGPSGGLRQAVHRDVRGVRQRIQIRVGIHLQDAGAQLLIQRAVVVLREAVKPPGVPATNATSPFVKPAFSVWPPVWPFQVPAAKKVYS